MHRAKWGRAARGDRAGQPSAGRWGGGETGRSAKGEATQKRKGRNGGGQPAATARAVRPEEGGEDREERKVRGDLRAKGRGGQGVRAVVVENSEQDHEECCEPQEMKRGGEGSREWEGREWQPNVQRALEDGHCAPEEEQGQEGKYWAKRNGESEGWSKWDAGKRKK